MARNSTYLDQAFDEELQKLLEIFIKKHKDYGKENILDNGELGIIFRVNDKLRRLQNLAMKGDAAVNESTRDSWQDIAVYSVIALLLADGRFRDLVLDPKK
jgi:glutaredoxin 2